MIAGDSLARMSSKRTTTGGSTKQARENARQAAINLIPPAQLAAAEEFGEAATNYAAALEHLRQQEEKLRTATEQARQNNWNQAQLRQLLEQLDLAEVSLPKRSTRSARSEATPTTAATNAPQSPEPDSTTDSPGMTAEPFGVSTGL